MKSPMRHATEVRWVAVSLSDGIDFRLDGTEEIRDHTGHPCPLWHIPEVLADPGGWIEYTTTTQFTPVTDPEWADEPEWYPSRVRVFGRAVATVGVVWESEP